ncbi:putative polysaccharide lyase family 8, N terminal alpha-helical domain [Lyophyllum shimeji]|uniref:Polysaccharide lyase family 8, N terminal alpha-helical domain n=1 Tax=Lyophyllum shimeji TaxID=47721 RepID=A0A9P3PIR5_LYOSH|nr:putative polysaccharide lyase family 8, N terminal alpha-helical domain [Lyophyllum shimeji]
MKQTTSIFLLVLLALFSWSLKAVSGADIDTGQPLSQHDKTFRLRYAIHKIVDKVPAFRLSTLGSSVKWPDSEINYSTGCDAQEASWSTQSHWSRINTLAAAWYGGLRNAARYTRDPELRAAISNAMNYWFSRDFTNPACPDSGGTPSCPCSTPGFWNQNWSSNVSHPHIDRAYNTFQTGINGVSAITGANTLDIASIGIDAGSLISNASLVSDAYSRIHDELAVKNELKVNGIRADGSFGQHAGILYTGNYGKDYANDILSLELAAAGTQFQASSNSRAAFTALLDANQWMVLRNVVTGVLHWDYSVLGRIISLPVSANQATAHLKMNLTQIQVLGQLWDSSAISQVYSNSAFATTDANSGGLSGNRMFYANDYMVHRGPGYVSTLKMYSKRTQNTECTNSQNPLGSHLSDAARFIPTFRVTNMKIFSLRGTGISYPGLLWTTALLL